jgi:hypothetical protein
VFRKEGWIKKGGMERMEKRESERDRQRPTDRYVRVAKSDAVAVAVAGTVAWRVANGE